GRVSAEGPPLEVLAAAPGGTTGGLSGVRNAFPAVVEGDADGGETRLRLAGGPVLIVPRLDRPPGTARGVSVPGEEVLLARGPVAGLSARNVIPGEVVRVVAHGHDAEVVVRTGPLTWIASVVGPAVDALGLQPGAAVSMIVKARSCHVRPDEVGPG